MAVNELQAHSIVADTVIPGVITNFESDGRDRDCLTLTN